MMSILIEQLINITDAIFLGHVGEIELGASRTRRNPGIFGHLYARFRIQYRFTRLSLHGVMASSNIQKQVGHSFKDYFFCRV